MNEQRPRYEKPCLYPLNPEDPLSASGLCRNGSGDQGQCNTGINTGANCSDGNVAAGNCFTGSSATNKQCKPNGFFASTRCTNGLLGA
jgi:hypothetical protein